MELGMRFDSELNLDGNSSNTWNETSEQVSPGGEPRRESERGSASERRYERFEPITIRAAARVLQLQQAGIVSSWEAGFYLHELVDMDRYATRGAYPSLLRMAQRNLGHRALTRVRSTDEPEGARPFCLDHPACMGLELALCL